MEQAVASDIMRFVSIRPPQLADPEKALTRFIPYIGAPYPRYLEPLFPIVNDPEYRALRRQRAAAFMDSPNYVGNAPHWQAIRPRLEAAHRAHFTKLVPGQPPPIPELRQMVETLAACFGIADPRHLVQDPRFGDWKDQAWSSLCFNILIPERRPLDRAFLLLAIRAIHLIQRWTQSGETPENALVLASFNVLTPLLPAPQLFLKHSDPNFQDGARPVGIADYHVVRHSLMRYQLGEIAHVQNVLKSEQLKREHRELQRVEETLATETETVSEMERDTQTTESSEMEREVERQVKEEMKFDTSVSLSYDGPVKVQAHAGFAWDRAKQESDRNSTKFARETTERAVTRMKQRSREQRSKMTVHQTDELNAHGFDNAAGDNITGIYRWLNKVYRARVYTYNTRLMYEFIVPEPGAYYRYVLRNRTNPKVLSATDNEPQQPTVANPGLITEANAPGHLATWGVQDPPVLPQSSIVVCATLELAAGDAATSVKVVIKDVPIDGNYRALSASAVGGVKQTEGKVHVIVQIGDYQQSFYIDTDPNDQPGPNNGGVLAIPDHAFAQPLTTSVPVSVIGDHLGNCVLNVRIRCERRPELFPEWQLKVFNKIWDAYREKLKAYREKLDTARGEVQDVSQGVVTTGKNPLVNRSVELRELRKQCIALLAAPEDPYAGSNGVIPNPQVDPFTEPELDVPLAVRKGRLIQFLEQAFEWERMSYFYYPYFWSRKSEWLDLQSLDSDDHMFAKFLTAGSARVVVPVSPAYEDAITFYQSTGEVWNGGDAPVVHDPLYVSIVDEIRFETAPFLGARPLADTWEYTIPTSLVYLQKGSDLPEFEEQIG